MHPRHSHATRLPSARYFSQKRLAQRTQQVWTAGNLNRRTNNTLTQQFNLNVLNQMTNIVRGGTLTVEGLTTAQATNVTVNTANAVLYADNSFVATNITLANGTNTFTAIASDSLGRKDTNTTISYLPATNSYAFDLNGNLTTNGSLTLDYDDENELIRVTLPNNWKQEYVYDGKFRRRVLKDFNWSGGAWVQTNEVRFVYDGNSVIQERDTNNNPMVTYTRSGSGLLARTDSALLNGGSPLAHAYYHRDGNGNVTALMYANQTLAAKYAYDPFGNIQLAYGTLASANSYRFAGKEFSDRTGLIYFGRRYYEPNLQRFINRDPLAERGGLNLYGYCGNNAICLIDQMGLLPCWMQNLWNALTDDGPALLPTQDPTSIYYYMTPEQIAQMPSQDDWFDNAVDAIGMTASQIDHVVGGIADDMGWSKAQLYALPALADPALLFASEANAGERMVQVTSWADVGITPDLNPGRWVQLGDATKLNFWMTGLQGPKLFLEGEAPFIRLQSSQVPFLNSITDEVPASSLQWPQGAELWKGILRQRQLKQP